MRKVLALQVGAVAGGILLATALGLPAAQAACGDYGQPPCPVPTVTPQPPSPSPSVTPRPTVTPTPTPIETPIPVPTETTNPQRAEVVGDGAVIVVSQETAERSQPRLMLQPLGSTINTSQVVVVERLVAEQIIVQFLKPRLKYVSQILVNRKWSTLGANATNAKGQLILPALRGVAIGTYPVRVVPDPPKNVKRPPVKFFQLSIVRGTVRVTPSPTASA